MSVANGELRVNRVFLPTSTSASDIVLRNGNNAFHVTSAGALTCYSIDIENPGSGFVVPTQIRVLCNTDEETDASSGFLGTRSYNDCVDDTFPLTLQGDTASISDDGTIVRVTRTSPGAWAEEPDYYIGAWIQLAGTPEELYVVAAYNRESETIGVFTLDTPTTLSGSIIWSVAVFTARAVGMLYSRAEQSISAAYVANTSTSDVRVRRQAYANMAAASFSAYDADGVSSSVMPTYIGTRRVYVHDVELGAMALENNAVFMTAGSQPYDSAAFPVGVSTPLMNVYITGNTNVSLTLNLHGGSADSPPQVTFQAGVRISFITAAADEESVTRSNARVLSMLGADAVWNAVKLADSTYGDVSAVAVTVGEPEVSTFPNTETDAVVFAINLFINQSEPVCTGFNWNYQAIIQLMGADASRNVVLEPVSQPPPS